MINSRKTVAAGIFLLTVIFSQASFATECTCLGEPESSVKLASVKLCRGIANIATGWGEIFRQPIVCTMEDGISGIPVGLFNGVFMTIIRTGSGILDVVFFPWALDGNDGYGSLVDPDYVWQCACCECPD
jgi:putative exosortase-associated protein (TIGR04073 family)